MTKQPETDEEWTEYFHKEVDPYYGDTEEVHGMADGVLIDFLKSKGYHKLAEAWNEVPKWYS